MLTLSSLIPAEIGVYNERLTVIIGFVAVVLVLVVFSSCRSFASLLAGFRFKGPLQTKWYRAFYKYHAYYWPMLWLLVVLHVMTALMHTELPVAGDPDAAIHWYILGSGLIAFLSLVALGFSCRTFAGVFNILTGKSLTEGRLNGTFYGYHYLYWLVFLLATAMHLVFSYLHVGFWPGTPG